MLITGMAGGHAADIVTWRYPAPYDCYDMTAADPAFLADPASGTSRSRTKGGSSASGPSALTARSLAVPTTRPLSTPAAGCARNSPGAGSAAEPPDRPGPW